MLLKMAEFDRSYTTSYPKFQ